MKIILVPSFSNESQRFHVTMQTGFTGSLRASTQPGHAC